MTSLATAGSASRSRTYVLCLLTLIATLSFIDRNIILILQEQIRRDFMLKDWQLGLMTGTVFTLFAATLAMPIARFADRGATRTTIIAVSVAGWSFMTIVCGMAQNYGQLLLARCGVGIGNAGAGSSTHSIISDLYSVSERSRAMAIWCLAIPLGAALGLLLGGWLAQTMGWHGALMLVGFPGILVALLFKITVPEPPRGLIDGKAVGREDHMPIGAAIRTMLSNRTYLHVLTAGMVASMCSLGMNIWFPPFFMRVHGMSVAEVGLGWGLLTGAAGVIGILGGGWLSDRFGSLDSRRIVWVPTAGMLISVPFYWASVLAGSPIWSLAFLFVPMVMNNIWIAPVTALAMSLVPVPIRATSSATMTLVHNIVGGAAAPLLLGGLSDLLAARAGDPAEGLRWMLLIVGGFYFWAAAHFWTASRTIGRDLA